MQMTGGMFLDHKTAPATLLATSRNTSLHYSAYESGQANFGPSSTAGPEQNPPSRQYLLAQPAKQA